MSSIRLRAVAVAAAATGACAVGALVLAAGAAAGPPAGRGPALAREASRARSSSPEKLLTESAAALRGARGYQVKGYVTEGKQRTRLLARIHSARSLDLTLTAGAQTVEVLFASPRFYLRANAAYWVARAGSRAASLGGDWFTIPASTGRSAVGNFAPRTFARCLTEDNGALSFTGTGTVAGRRTVVIKDAGNVAGGQPGTLAIAATGRPWPLRLTSTSQQRTGGHIDACNDGKGGDDDGVLTLSDFNAVGPIASPLKAIKLPTSS
jgi:hypothetical protein